MSAFLHDEEVEISGGRKVKLPPLTLRKVLTLTKSIANLVNKGKEILPATVLDGTMPGTQMAVEVMKILPNFAPQLIEELAEVIAVYLGINKDEILDQYTPEDVVAVATPFFVRIIKSGNMVVGKFNDLFPVTKTNQPIQPISEETSKDNLQP